MWNLEVITPFATRISLFSPRSVLVYVSRTTPRVHQRGIYFPCLNKAFHSSIVPKNNSNQTPDNTNDEEDVFIPEIEYSTSKQQKTKEGKPIEKNFTDLALELDLMPESTQIEMAKNMDMNKFLRKHGKRKLTELDEELIFEVEKARNIKIDRNLCYVHKSTLFYKETLQAPHYTKVYFPEYSPDTIKQRLTKDPKAMKMMLEDLEQTGGIPDTSRPAFKYARRLNDWTLLSLLASGKQPPFVSKEYYERICKAVLEFCKSTTSPKIAKFLDRFPNAPRTALSFYLFHVGGGYYITGWLNIFRAYKKPLDNITITSVQKFTTQQISVINRCLNDIRTHENLPPKLEKRVYRSKSVPNTPEADLLLLKYYKLYGTSFIKYSEAFPGVRPEYLQGIFMTRIWRRYFMKKLKPEEMDEEKDREIVAQSYKEGMTIKDILFKRLNHRDYIWLRSEIRKIRLAETSRANLLKLQTNFKALYPESLPEAFPDVISRRNKSKEIITPVTYLIADDMVDKYLELGGFGDRMKNFLLEKHRAKITELIQTFITNYNKSATTKDFTFVDESWVIDRSMANMKGRALRRIAMNLFTPNMDLRLALGFIQKNNNPEDVAKDFFGFSSLPFISKELNVHLDDPTAIFVPDLLSFRLRYLSKSSSSCKMVIDKRTLVRIILYNISSDMEALNSIIAKFDESCSDNFFLRKPVDSMPVRKHAWDSMLGLDPEQQSSEEHSEDLNNMELDTANSDIEVLTEPTQEEMNKIFDQLINLASTKSIRDLVAHTEEMDQGLKQCKVILPNGKNVLIDLSKEKKTIFIDIYKAIGYHQRYYSYVEKIKSLNLHLPSNKLIYTLRLRSKQWLLQLRADPKQKAALMLV